MFLCSLHNFDCDCAYLKSFFFYIHISYLQQTVELWAVLARNTRKMAGILEK